MVRDREDALNKMMKGGGGETMACVLHTLLVLLVLLKVLKGSPLLM